MNNTKHEILKDKTLALFFSYGVSLKTWHDIGMIDREVAIYNELGKYLEHIYFFTYGDNGDLEFKSYLASNITVVPQKFIPHKTMYSAILYSFILPVIHRKVLKHVDILKTNQMAASWTAALSKLIYRKKLIVRTGYTWSILYSEEHPTSWKTMLIKQLERFAYKMADAATTSSVSAFNYVERNYHPRNHIFVTNYIETDVFKPLDRVRRPASICFVGGLRKQKNTLALLEALKGLPYCIDIIGTGSMSAQLQEFAASNGIKANFLGNIPNHELPEILNQHELFILPSLWEGMPKTLLEAMSCGLPVIGTRVTGIQEVIEDGKNGILCDTDSGSIQQAITRLMADEKLRKQLGENARKTIEERFSLEKLVDKELELYTDILMQAENAGKE
jgi:glycosyltransferase involved in cell wall biosynthesis